MTLAKSCQASNMMQDLKKQLMARAYCNHESFLNRDVSVLHCLLIKIESHLES